jgi:predicted hydrocarbon binding protein
MKKYLDRHNGNFSAAIRDIIENSERYGLPTNVCTVDDNLLNWLMDNINGRLIPDNILNDILDPRFLSSFKTFENYIHQKIKELNWNIDLILKYDNDINPTNLMIEIKGPSKKIKFVSLLLCQYLSNNLKNFEIKYVNRLDNSIKIEMQKSDQKISKESLINHFGDKEEVIDHITKNPIFWKSIIHKHIVSNYNMITVHRNYFEDLLANKIPMGEIMIENIAKKPVQDINIKEMLLLIKEVYETSRVIDRVDIWNENITIYHSFRSLEAIDKIKKSLIMLLESSGHLYDAHVTSNMLILKHRPDIGIKINEIVDKLKSSSNRIDQELVMFLTFIKGLKETPDVPLSLTTLGRRIGKSLLVEYEKENNIKRWDLNLFKNALETINTKINMGHELKLEGDILLYRVSKCNIAIEGGFNNYICHTFREVFKGAMNHAFGNDATLIVNKLLSHGDDCCEVIIRLEQIIPI